MKELTEKIERLRLALLLMKQYDDAETCQEAIQSLTQEPSAVSAEEIWDKYKTEIPSGYGYFSFVLKEQFLQAMQEYYNASREEHAIGFAEWVINTDDDRFYSKTKTELYTEYLNTLTTK